MFNFIDDYRVYVNESHIMLTQIRFALIDEKYVHANEIYVNEWVNSLMKMNSMKLNIILTKIKSLSM